MKSKSHRQSKHSSGARVVDPSGGGFRGKSPRRVERASLPEGIFVVEGVAAIREYLRHKPDSVMKIFAKDRALNQVKDELAGFKVHVIAVSENGSEVLPPTPAWAHIKHEMIEWSECLERIQSRKNLGRELILVLDHISDPRNLGAIVRTAAFFGVKHVIVPEKRQVLLTQASVNTAQGGFALTDLVLVVNVSRTLEELKRNDYWVLGAAMGGEPLAKVRGRFDRQVLVLGAEDKGISQHVLGRCDVQIAIPGGDRTLDSLNVSVAAGILVHGLVTES